MKFNFKEILDFLKGQWEKFKAFWAKLSKKTKILVVAGGSLLLFLLILVTILINVGKNTMRVIFPGMSSDESTQVYATLQEMGVQPQIDNRGQVLVPSEMWDDLVFQLNSKGYPKTALSYDTFSNFAGFTATEFEKRTGLLFQTQEDVQKTLMRQTGIEDAVVQYTVPESSNYIWDQTNQQESTAGVTIRMKTGYELTPERVSAIKHLVATGIPKLDPTNVVVIDAATGIEMAGVDDPNSKGYYSVQRLEYERLIAKQIEDNVKRLLSGRYGSDGVTAVATVALDYDKMVSESKQYNNEGTRNHFEENYTLNGSVAAGGIVGEENNTDAPPIYPNDDGTGNAEATDYYRHIDYDVGYIMTQIEKGEPVLQRASVAVIVNDANYNIDVEETLIDLISKAVNITSDNISVTNLNFDDSQQTMGRGLTARQRLLLILGLSILFVILLVVVILLTLQAKKKKKLAEEAAAAETATQDDINRAIEEHKRMLQNEALANSNQVESAITQEIRDFAKENPEITASLLRSLLKEEQ